MRHSLNFQIMQELQTPVHAGADGYEQQKRM